MTERASELRTLLPCPLCGRSLFPAPGDSIFTFHCRSGHAFSLDELLGAQSAIVQGGLESLVADWERLYHRLMDTVEDARKNSHHDVAEIFSRHAKTLETRIRTVRDAFAQSESSQVIRLPQALRT